LGRAHVSFFPGRPARPPLLSPNGPHRASLFTCPPPRHRSRLPLLDPPPSLLLAAWPHAVSGPRFLLPPFPLCSTEKPLCAPFCFPLDRATLARMNRTAISPATWHCCLSASPVEFTVESNKIRAPAVVDPLSQ
jgi:hypothetical protein